MVEREVRPERARPLTENLERAPSPLGRRVVPDHQAQRARYVRDGGDLEARGGSTPDRLLERLAHDLVQRRLRLLAERVDRRHVERDLDPVLAAAGLRERVDRRGETVVAQRHRFEVVATTDTPGTLRLVIRDDAPTERRRRALEVLGERARTLGANLTLDHDIGGTIMSLELRGQPTGDD